MQIRRVLALCIALALGASGSPAFAQRNNNEKQPKRSKAEQADVYAILKMVDGAAPNQPAPAVPIAWESNHFVKGQEGSTYIPFTLTVDRSKLAKGDV